MTTKIVGTNHLDSKEMIEDIIKKEKPDILGVELCELRVNAILNEDKITLSNSGEVRKGMGDMSVKANNLLDKITNSIKKKAEEQKMDYGSDQKSVLRYANKNNIPLVLVDMPILKIQELFNKIPKSEQEGFTKELMEFESQGQIDKEVNEEEVLVNLKTRYPIAFEFLINMRNLYISNQIIKCINKNPDKKILVFVGKSHREQIERMLQ
jgi:pheromone shutdown protein TraB